MLVSWNGGTPSDHPFLDGFSLTNHPFGGTPIYGNTHVHDGWCGENNSKTKTMLLTVDGDVKWWFMVINLVVFRIVDKQQLIQSDWLIYCWSIL